MNGTLPLIEAELQLAGTDPAVRERVARLEQRRITPDKELPEMRFLFRLFGTPCFPRGELVAVTGKAKSGKTFFTSMLMAMGTAPPPSQGEEPEGGMTRIPALQRVTDEPIRVMWYDTEQSEESTQDILRNRIMKMTVPLHEGEDGVGAFHVFNVRGEPWKERMPLLEAAVLHYRPDLVIVDGIRDLVNDINDGCLAQEVVEGLMHLAAETGCCIVCVLHQNKGADDRNLRGWIGTELTNKAFEVYACDKDVNRLFSVEQTHTRKYDLKEKLYYSVDADGLPRQVGESKASGNETVQKKYPALNHQYVVGYDDDGLHFDLVRLFCDALGNADFLSHFDLQQRVMELSGIRSYQLCSNVFREAVETKIIVKEKDADQHVVYRLTPF